MTSSTWRNYQILQIKVNRTGSKCSQGNKLRQAALVNNVVLPRIGNSGRSENDELEEARNILVAHCNPEFIEKKLVETWKPIKVFHERLDVFQEALFAHRNKKFRAAIYTLIPQIEGVITDWLYEHLDSEPVEWKTKPKIDQFITNGTFPSLNICGAKPSSLRIPFCAMLNRCKVSTIG